MLVLLHRESISLNQVDDKLYKLHLQFVFLANFCIYFVDVNCPHITRRIVDCDNNLVFLFITIC